MECRGWLCQLSQSSSDHSNQRHYRSNCNVSTVIALDCETDINTIDPFITIDDHCQLEHINYTDSLIVLPYVKNVFLEITLQQTYVKMKINLSKPYFLKILMHRICNCTKGYNCRLFERYYRHF